MLWVGCLMMSPSLGWADEADLGFKGVADQLQSLGITPKKSTPVSSTAPAVSGNANAAPATLEETRLTMNKWIETQQIISKERKDWQQGKEILQGRLDVVKKEIAMLEEKTGQNRSGVAESDKKRRELESENNLLKDANLQLTEAVTGMEAEVKRLFKRLPETLQTKLAPLYERIPEDSSKTRVSVAERFQNVLGILNELNKANNEITVNYEIHSMSDGKSSEVKAIYVGLAQAYYVSMRGEGGIGKPGEGGWKWESSKEVGPQALMALEILQGKHTPIFVSLPVEIE